MLTLKPQKAKRPAWLKVKLNNYYSFQQTQAVLKQLNLATVCQHSVCPNLASCFSARKATFLLLGDICTRQCGFCQIKRGVPKKLDPDEPQKLVQAVKTLGLKKVVLTCVTRDDLPDGGAEHLAFCVRHLKKTFPQLFVELLIPDFKLQPDALKIIFQSQPDVIGHNIETVARLYRYVRAKADYNHSLNLLTKISLAGFKAKSSLILGLGETYAETIACLEDIYKTGVQEVSLGQYLPPSSQHAPVKRYFSPAYFRHIAFLAKKIGFSQVKSAPLVRSSY